MLRQNINGSVKKTVMLNGSQADLEAVSNIIAGKIEIYVKTAEGGTDTPVPTPLNARKFSVGKVYVDHRKSEAVNLPHMKTTKTGEDFRVAVLGVWDESFISSVKCGYVNAIGNSSRG